MSRHPQKLNKSTITDDVDMEIYGNKFIATHAVPKAMTLEEVKAATEKDGLLQHHPHWPVTHTENDTFTSERDQSDLKSFYNVKEEQTETETWQNGWQKHTSERTLHRHAKGAAAQSTWTCTQKPSGAGKNKQGLVPRNRQAGRTSNISLHPLSSIKCSQQTSTAPDVSVTWKSMAEYLCCGPFPSGDYILSCFGWILQIPLCRDTTVDISTHSYSVIGQNILHSRYS